mmetsp:Transcript_9082/g.30051  ORF Transcript_9082/g.30051 Transcript_9082/m.30051 type:complete len:136 (+) Transcript_9082:42-449(+)
MSATPAELEFEEKAVPLWRYQQLDQLSKHHLKNRARNLEDSVGKSRLPLRVAQDSESLICWIIDVQVMLSEAVGTPISHSEFGLPKALLARREGQDMPSPDMAPPTDRGEHGDSQGAWRRIERAATAALLLARCA